MYRMYLTAKPNNIKIDATYLTLIFPRTTLNNIEPILRYSTGLDS